MANGRNGAIYTGVTSNPVQRVYQHREDSTDDFMRRYNCKMLVHFELLGTIIDAIEREKQIKAGSRKKKLALIEATNSTWRDLYFDLF
jgi:putative endonuclease